jgi:hypothetical protein
VGEGDLHGPLATLVIAPSGGDTTSTAHIGSA